VLSVGNVMLSFSLGEFVRPEIEGKEKASVVTADEEAVNPNSNKNI
jgi:hypothetical protein